MSPLAEAAVTQYVMPEPPSTTSSLPGPVGQTVSSSCVPTAILDTACCGCLGIHEDELAVGLTDQNQLAFAVHTHGIVVGQRQWAYCVVVEKVRGGGVALDWTRSALSRS